MIMMLNMNNHTSLDTLTIIGSQTNNMVVFINMDIHMEIGIGTNENALIGFNKE